MVDIENKVIDTIENAFTAESKTVLVLSEYTMIPPSFPCLMVREITKSAYTNSLDTSNSPHQYNVTYQLDYFSNLESGAKDQVKELSQIGDSAMTSMKFVLESFNIITNEDRTISRATARYRAIVENGVTVGTTTKFQIYR